MQFEFQDKVIEFNIKNTVFSAFYFSGGNHLSTDIGRHDY